MADVFGYNNNVKSTGQIASADFARIAIGSSSNSLVQSVRVGYQQQIEEVTEVGSPQIHWLPGRPSGSISVASLVGSNGFFQGWKGECGRINTASININGGRCGFSGGGSLFFSGAIVQSLSAEINTGRQTISQGAEIKTASMSG